MFSPFSKISEDDNQYQAHADVDVLLAEFRQRIFMSPRAPFPMPNQQTTAFTEKNWYSLAYAVWESHKSNYFLRKFESLKEKEWALRVWIIQMTKFPTLFSFLSKSIEIQYLK